MVVPRRLGVCIGPDHFFLRPFVNVGPLLGKAVNSKLGCKREKR